MHCPMCIIDLVWAVLDVLRLQTAEITLVRLLRRLDFTSHEPSLSIN